MSDTRATTQSVQYRERLWVPWWWSLPAAVLAGVIAFEIGLAAPAIPAWLPYVLLFGVAGAVLMWFSKTELKVVRLSSGVTELYVGDAHLPTSVISRSAEVPRSAKSAALGRQLDPAAYVVHRAWVGPMVLVVLDDPDDPTPYWLVSSRHPDRVLAALRG
ncbi:DUF3093 domain-containing protein [Mycolicibacterium neworleansense]|uniref:DUF3093 domain-containing protein n=1 Tax=Mycolicibacterium neworleansense TaxID=146018 RepID=UPI000B83D5A5|nr:DUF3093 domain-containing protein [Mycolicibacterium neworleansense]MCV7363794.1 DUF3093 domain-containing protein [Mycolicibacterium neworleansense]